MVWFARLDFNFSLQPLHLTVVRTLQFYTIWLPLTALTCRILPYFAFSVTESQIINNFFCPANRGKTGQNTAFQEADRIWQRYFLFATASRDGRRTFSGKTRHIAANLCKIKTLLLLFYYRFTTSFFVSKHTVHNAVKRGKSWHFMPVLQKYLFAIRLCAEFAWRKRIEMNR